MASPSAAILVWRRLITSSASADGQILEEIVRQKPYHSHHDHPGQAGGHNGGHTEMFAPIADCQVLLCGGMGQPAYQKALDAGLQVVLTGGELRAAVEAYLSGQVVSDLRRIHQH